MLLSKIISCAYVRYSELLNFHYHQNQHVLGHFQYYDLLYKTIKCTKILFLSHCVGLALTEKKVYLNSEHLESDQQFDTALQFRTSAQTTISNENSRWQLHQRFTSSFFLYKSVMRSSKVVTVWFCNFFVERKFAQKLLANCWRN